MQKYKVRDGNEVLYIAGSRTDISGWTSEDIADYLTKFPKAVGHFDPVVEEPTVEEPTVENSVVEEIDYSKEPGITYFPKKKSKK